MAVKTKRAVVSKKISDDQLKNSIRWESFIEASGTPFLSLSNEWLEFFSAQAEIETASDELIKLIDRAIEVDNKRKGAIL